MFDTSFEYVDHLRANAHWVGGEALQPPEAALTLYWKNGKVATTDGHYAETEEQLSGIGVIEARDMNKDRFRGLFAAIMHVSSHSHFLFADNTSRMCARRMALLLPVGRLR